MSFSHIVAVTIQSSEGVVKMVSQRCGGTVGSVLLLIYMKISHAIAVIFAVGKKRIKRVNSSEAAGWTVAS